ncbi:hypothetical protein RSOL_240070 [Rhizoctonia solani AG-3 Rhs1AP]|uniref:Uncharacterized protein n=1 Tax=Rhizoctonia solani AG-3 Rhs1AP TaxID=1086054 RepID=A0A0A1UHK9_9AGAM|nr:hypothetical protein RSOL_240070 [Rhizoctonia solani AG-3 Rhs1AP]
MRVTAPAGTNGTIVIPRAANKTVVVNGAEVHTNGNATLPEGVTWVGAEGDGYRVNVTSGTSAFTISAS